MYPFVILLDTKAARVVCLHTRVTLREFPQHSLLIRQGRVGADASVTIRLLTARGFKFRKFVAQAAGLADSKSEADRRWGIPTLLGGYLWWPIEGLKRL